MENQLFEVNKKNLSLVYEIVQSFRGQKFFTGTSMFSQLLNNMNLVAEYVFSQEDGCCNLKEELEQILPALLQAQSNQDYILQADILEGDLLPLLQKVQIRLQSEDAVTIEDYWEDNMQALKLTNIKLYEILQQGTKETEWFSKEKKVWFLMQS